MRWIITTTFYLVVNSCNSQNIIFKSGTTVLTAITPDSIIMAADSKYTDTELDGKTVGKPKTACKIQHTGNIFYAFAGLASIFYDGKEILNCYKTLAKVTAYKQNFTQTFYLFDLNIKQEVQSLTMRFKEDFYSLINTTLLQIAMVSFEYGRPVYKTGRYVFKLNRMKQYYIEYVDEASKTFPFMYEIGHYENITKFLSAHKDYLYYLDNIYDKLSTLIKLEIKNNSKDVGLPIDIVKITQNGFIWKSKKQSCN